MPSASSPFRSLLEARFPRTGSTAPGTSAVLGWYCHPGKSMSKQTS
jgi:hypothetical protein